MEFGQRLFQIYSIDAIPPLHESDAKPVVCNPPAFFVYLQHCIDSFHAFIHTLRLPHVEDPHVLFRIFGSHKFPKLRELRFTCLESMGLMLNPHIIFSPSLTTLDVSNPSQAIIEQLFSGFPCVETLTLRDVKYVQLDDLFKRLEERSKLYNIGSCAPLKRLSITMETKNAQVPAGTGTYSALIDTWFSEVKYLRQFLFSLNLKAKAVFSKLEYLHMSAVGHDEIMKIYLTDLSEMANENSSSCFAPCTTVDFGFSPAKLKLPCNNMLSIGHQVIDMADILDKQHRASIIPPMCFSYSTTIMFRTYEDLFALSRSGKTMQVLQTLSDLDLRHLRVLKLPFCINLQNQNACFIRQVLQMIKAVLDHLPHITRLEVSTEVLESGTRLNPGFISFVRSLKNLKVVHFQNPDRLTKRRGRPVSYERNNVLLGRLADFLYHIRENENLEMVHIEVSSRDRTKESNIKSKLNRVRMTFKDTEKQMRRTDLSSFQSLIASWVIRQEAVKST